MPEAVRVAAEIKEKFGVESKLTAGGRGVFDVFKDGKLVYSKGKTGDFPKPGEVSKLL